MNRIISSAFFAAVVALGGIVAFGQNYKIKQTTSMAGMGGHEMTSTVFVKGSRKRTESGGMMGMGADVATIEQCDLNRTVEVNDKKKLYYISETRSGAAAAPAARGSAPTIAKPVKGGIVTQTTNITDTGERKQMFGLTARHIKTTMTMTSSPDACSKSDMSMETDGWYVDLPQFSCPMPMARNPYAQTSRPGGCQDTVVTKFTGGGKMGFPLEMTQTMRSGGSDAFTQTITTVEFSKAVLDDALFNVPADYRLASSSQDLYGRPDFSAMMSGQAAPVEPDYGAANPSMPSKKKPGIIRIGVLMPTTRNADPVSTSALQSYLASQLDHGKVEGIAVGNEVEARAAVCDYLLTTDISKLKQSAAGKIGGMFGGVTGVPTAGKYDAQVDYALVSLVDGKKTLQSRSANKTETEANRAAESVLTMEAMAVIAAAK
jgi:hypothetical protein